MARHPRWRSATLAGETAVIAHRGAWATAAQNTLNAFEAAINVGADMIEFDVRRTGDGQLVVCHDARRDGLPLVGVRRAALGACDEPPPLLEEVLALACNRIAVNVELKERDCAREVIPLLERFGLDQCLLTSFHDDVVSEVKLRAPELRTGLLVGRYRSVSELFPAGRARRAGADVLVVQDRLADAGVLARVRLPCLVWTVNDPRRLERHLADPRVAGVITDVPELALALRDALALSARTEPATPC